MDSEFGFVLVNEQTGAFAAADSVGEHDGKTTTDFTKAKYFDNYGEGSDFAQNFGPHWFVRSALEA
jgi:hypothetical protein